jgi:formylglycine-generating enzyme required for sulfatase activity
MEEGTVVLPEITIPVAAVVDAMACIPSAPRFEMGSEHLQGRAPPHIRRLPAFFVDTSEFTNAQRTRLDRVFDQRPDCLPGPRPDDHAVVCLTLDEAIDLAERAGKRLPSEAEWEWVATHGGVKKRIPKTAALPESWVFGPVGQDGFDRVDLDPERPIYGMFSNVAEWTGSKYALYPATAKLGLAVPNAAGEAYVVRGGSDSVMNRAADRKAWDWGPCNRRSVPMVAAKPGLGFRCVRSAKPRLKPEDFEEVLEPGNPPAMGAPPGYEY